MRPLRREQAAHEVVGQLVGPPSRMHTTSSDGQSFTDNNTINGILAILYIIRCFQTLTRWIYARLIRQVWVKGIRPAPLSFQVQLQTFHPNCGGITPHPPGWKWLAYEIPGAICAHRICNVTFSITSFHVIGCRPTLLNVLAFAGRFLAN